MISRTLSPLSMSIVSLIPAESVCDLCPGPAFFFFSHYTHRALGAKAWHLNYRYVHRKSSFHTFNLVV